ncbi:hypothetical protein [Pseudomonas putida]|uniref:Uncharacterized protein n=1 Tax=Pseudomonas putida TaxID=303 RepID=A0A2S3WBB7_PSEPU|nr:hypothetical protein [Pseudomonas putida]POF88236.1 hypothetical protein BGP80_09750 [Pseudomonas putida]
MNSDRTGLLMPDHEMYLQVTAALKRYHEAKDMGAPATEVDRLRQIYEAHFQAVTEYQLKALTGKGAVGH